ncbi:uncharacterized protein LOC143365020 [Halictus rubicundus]|uniref:uncharacterized protein LOC143365018 n=1 Tax=Halictus rubicundus TaxID=77578 RepID=UPI0040373C19
MSDNIKLLIQKRSALKTQITIVDNLVEKGKLDNATLRLRITRLTDLFHAAEDANNEIALLEPDNGHDDILAEIATRFYDLAGRADNILNRPDISRADTDTANDSRSTDSAKGRPVKLPDASLPTFDGRYERWLSFKNAFNSMIGSRRELDDVAKLQYLRSALVQEAANKIRLFDVDGINYAKAWDILERAYENKRVLVSRHMSMLFDLPTLDKESTSGLTRLADDAQQHFASLHALGAPVCTQTVVHLLESKLPKITYEKWQAGLSRQEYPSLDEMLEFLYKTAVCVSRTDKMRSSDRDRERERDDRAHKRRRIHPPNRVFVTQERKCLACKISCHPLFTCTAFKRLTVPKRIELVKTAKVCFNCLRSHRDAPCRYSNCTICQRRHNTLLHNPEFASSSRADTSKPAIDNADAGKSA